MKILEKMEIKNTLIADYKSAQIEADELDKNCNYKSVSIVAIIEHCNKIWFDVVQLGRDGLHYYGQQLDDNQIAGYRKMLVR